MESNGGLFEKVALLGVQKLCINFGISKRPMAPHGLILSGNEAIPSTMLFILLLGLFEPIIYAFLMQIRPQGSGPRKLVFFLYFNPSLLSP